jgi:hypothetical protein
MRFRHVGQKPRTAAIRVVIEGKAMGLKKSSQFRKEKVSDIAPAAPALDRSKKALQLCLKRIKDAKNEKDLRCLTEQLQRIVFHRQYLNAED